MNVYIIVETSDRLTGKAYADVATAWDARALMQPFVYDGTFVVGYITSGPAARIAQRYLRHRTRRQVEVSSRVPWKGLSSALDDAWRAGEIARAVLAGRKAGEAERAGA